MDVRTARSHLRRARAGVRHVAGKFADPLFTVQGLSQAPRWGAAIAAGKAPHEIFGDVTDRWWLWAHTAGYRRFGNLRALLPGLPSHELQETFTGSSGDRTLKEGWHAYRLFRDTFAGHSDTGLDSTSRVLDFGCGWGRTIRFFVKDLPASGLFGVDVNPVVLNFCKESNPWAQFSLNDVLPPTDLPDASFDLIYGYSVFSHLSEEAHRKWAEEFARLLKPGGLLMVTTWPRSFIEHCEWLRTAEAAARLPDSHRISGGAFQDTSAALAAYDRGEFCFSYREPSDPEHFGEAAIPEAYIRRSWAEHFELAEYVDDRRRCPQNLIVCRRRVG